MDLGRGVVSISLRWCHTDETLKDSETNLAICLKWYTFFPKLSRQPWLQGFMWEKTCSGLTDHSCPCCGTSTMGVTLSPHLLAVLRVSGRGRRTQLCVCAPASLQTQHHRTVTGW